MKNGIDNGSATGSGGNLITEGRDAKTGRFLSGNGGGGRPKGSRNKLGEQFVSDLHQVWQERGIECIRSAMDQKPAEVLKVVASLLPRDIKVSVTETMSDLELSSRIGQLADALGLKLIPTDSVESQRAGTIELVPSTRQN